MECKFSSSDAIFGSPLELIDTLWNVNYNDEEETKGNIFMN